MAANIFAIIDRKQEMKEKRFQVLQLENFRLDIVKSINELVEELRQEKNERNNRDNK